MIKMKQVHPTETPEGKCESVGVLCEEMDFKYPGCFPICKLYIVDLVEGTDRKAIKCDICALKCSNPTRNSND
jgi:hypothetical protein